MIISYTLNMGGHKRILWGWAAQGHTAELPNSLVLKLVLFPSHHPTLLVLWRNVHDSFGETTEPGIHRMVITPMCNIIHCHWSVHWSLHSFQSTHNEAGNLNLLWERRVSQGSSYLAVLCAKMTPAESTNMPGFPNHRPGRTSTQDVICGTIHSPHPAL